ncbi:MAG: Druantia anti-phage system protein DruA [bacterium]
MRDELYIFRGRKFSLSEIKIIKKVIESNQGKSRRDISKKICELINWRQLNGKLKDAACREVLRRMNEVGIIDLPRLRLNPPQKSRRPKDRWKEIFKERKEPIEESLSNLGKVRLQMARSITEKRFWDYLIDKYHYLGYRRVIGNQVKYLIYSQGELLGCIGFADAVLKLNLRDRWIGWSIEQREKNLYLIINNVRFLILPWVKVRNLASKILSLVSKQVPEDWNSYYGYRPVLLETFVDVGRFSGTAYKAASWINLGRTKGKGRCGMKYFIHNRRKDIYVYPLCRNYLRLLRCCR